MSTEYKSNEKLMTLPLLQGMKGNSELTLTNPLQHFRKGEKGMFNVFKLVLFAALGYLSWVYILPPLFMMLGKAIALAGTLVFAVLFIMMIPVILKGIRRFTRFSHKMVIKHDPFGQLYETKDELEKTQVKFIKSQGSIKNLLRDTIAEAENSKTNVENLQRKIVSSKKKIDDVKLEQQELKKQGATSSAEYINNHATLIKLNAKVQGQMQKKNQQQDFISKYGARAATMQKLDHKLILVGAQINSKIDTFDNTIEILKNDYEFAKKSKEATDAAKSTMLLTGGWEADYALDVITCTIAENIAMTAANINDIDKLTSNYSIDDDELYSKLDALVGDIETGKDEVVDPTQYLSPDYKMTHKDNLNSGGFGDIF